MTRLAVLFALALAAALPARAETFWDLLRQPGTVAIMRHAIAPGTGDPGHFRLGDCATQRNLDARGRAQARSTGAAFRANGVAVTRVYTRQWCRARETAVLLDLGPIEDLPVLNSFFRDRSGRDAATEGLRAFLATLAPDDRAVLVTHQVNITALTARDVSSGEVFALRIEPDGTVTVLGSIVLQP